MNRLYRSDVLIVAIVTGMIIRPGDVFVVLIVTNVSRHVGILMFSMEEMCPTNSAQGT